jgi:hypothetical protein
LFGTNPVSERDRYGEELTQTQIGSTFLKIACDQGVESPSGSKMRPNLVRVPVLRSIVWKICSFVSCNVSFAI